MTGEMSKTLTFSGPWDATEPVGRPAPGHATTINITDDDVPAVTVQFSQGSYTVVEGATCNRNADPDGLCF